MPLNLKIFSAVLSGCGSAKEWQMAMAVLSDAERSKIQLDTVACDWVNWWGKIQLMTFFVDQEWHK